MRSLIICCVLLLIISCSPAKRSFHKATIITHVNTIDAVEGLMHDRSVIIVDEKIAAIEASNNFNLTGESIIIDGKDKYLIPGLWDAHVHFAYIEELAPAMFDLFLSYGVTSVRDTGGRTAFVKKWRDAANADPYRSPRVKIAGPLIDGMPNVYDGSDPTHPPLSLGSATVEEASALVDQLADEDVDLLKAYEMLSPEQFMAIARRAKDKGLKLTGHVPLSMDVISACDAGLNSIEHMRNVEMSCATNAAELLATRRDMLAAGAKDKGGALRSRIHAAQRIAAIKNQDAAKTADVIAAFIRNDTWQIPTLSIMTAMSNRHFLREEWQASFDDLPAEIAKRWREGTAQVASMEITEDQILYAEWQNDIIKKMHQAGVQFMAGTDCPIFFLTPGLSLHEELALLVNAGFTPLEALGAATIKPSAYFNLQDQLGLIKENMIADLVLLDANPLDDIRNTLRINTVIKNGQIQNRKHSTATKFLN